MIYALILIGSVVLTPGDGFVGFFSAESCIFQYPLGRETIFAEDGITYLDVVTAEEVYAPGSTIPRGAGMVCSDCWVPEYVLDGATGQTTFTCQVNPKYGY